MAKRRDVSWSDLKAQLAQFDRNGLVGLLKDLSELRPENRAFLAARLGVGGDPLKPYKTTIARWISPDVMKNQEVSVSKAKAAIADYRKAIGRTEGMAELSIFYCEEAAGLIDDVGMDDEAYFAAFIRMYEQGVTHVLALPLAERGTMLARLNAVRGLLRGVGWGVSDALDEIWHRHIDQPTSAD